MWRVSWMIAGSEQSGREESPDTGLRQQTRAFGLRVEVNGQRAW
jgi:hypothetical protein